MKPEAIAEQRTANLVAARDEWHTAKKLARRAYERLQAAEQNYVRIAAAHRARGKART